MHDSIYPYLENLKERVHGSADWASLDFSINTNPLGPPDSIIQVLTDTDLNWLTKYPTINATILKERLATKLGILKEQVIIGNGAAELFFLLPRVLKINRGIIIHPTFGEYEPSLISANVPIKRLYYSQKDDKFIFPMDEVKDTLTAGDLIYLCRPNNPTGQMVSVEEIEQLLSLVEKRKTHLLVDESFIDFTEELDGLLNYFQDNKSLLLIRSLTKFYTIPGIRLGYMIAPSQLIHSLELSRDPWSVNALSQRIGLQIIKDEEFINKTWLWIKEEREWVFNQLKQLTNLKVFPSTSNFHLIQLLNGNLNELYNYLKTKGIAIRLTNSFLGLENNYFRLAVRKREDNLLIIEELKRFVSSS